MKLSELAQTKLRRSGEVSWFDSLSAAQRREIVSELKKWGDQPLAPFARAVIEAYKLRTKMPAVRDTLRALQNGKTV